MIERSITDFRDWAPVDIRDLIEVMGSITLVAKGRSMWPAIDDGESIAFIPCEPDEIRKNQIVLAWCSSSWRVHRVIQRSQYGCLLRGDTNHSSDGWIPWEHIVAALSPNRPRNWRSALRRGKLKASSFLNSMVRS